MKQDNQYKPEHEFVYDGNYRHYGRDYRDAFARFLLLCLVSAAVGMVVFGNSNMVAWGVRIYSRSCLGIVILGVLAGCIPTGWEAVRRAGDMRHVDSM